MSYTSPQPPIEFNFDAAYVAPIADSLAFNLGVSEKDATGIMAFTLDDCTGHFAGFLPPKYEGNFSATLDDCTGEILAAWLVQPKTLTASFSVTSNAAKVETLSVKLASKTAEKIAIKNRFEILTAQQLNYSALSRSQQASVKRAESLSRVQRAEIVRKNTRHHATDLHTYAHKFDSTLFKEPPLQYRYTPTAVFDFGVHLNEWTLSTTTNEYVASLPVEFDLNEIAPIGANFDLGLTQTQPVTRTRQIFDNVSTYQPEAVFFVPWVNDTLILNHSYQRAAMRIATNAPIKRAVKRDKAYLFALQKAIKLALFFAQKGKTTRRLQQNTHFSSRKAGNLSRKYHALSHIAQIIWGSNQAVFTTDPPRPPLPPNPPHNPNNETFTIPTKTVYQMTNTISVTLTDLTPIDVSDISLSLDAESWAWQFSCKLLNLAQLPLVTTLDNTAVELIVTINGFEWRVLVEKAPRVRKFADNSISLQGRSLSALLTQPYLQPRSATQSSMMTVQQLAELELPAGWTIDWQAQTWNVPAGAFSYTYKTPMQVISEIAADIGAIVVPSRNSKSLKILPRYPVLPWYFDQATPNLIIPDSALDSVTYHAIIPAQANGVYVHGGEIGGVIAWCRLTGTDGARLAQTVTNTLMTDVIGCRALGERILAGQYTQPALQSVTLPMNATDMPLANIGNLIRINIDDTQVRGIVNSISISANLDSVFQTVQIGEETANVWSAFKQILPSEPLLVGTLSSTDGQTSLMTLVDGGVIRVRGTGSLNSKYYIRAGRIENPAPNLTLSEIVV